MRSCNRDWRNAVNGVTGSGFRIRMAVQEDAFDIATFYAPYVLDTAINFEYEPPSAEDYRHRIIDVERRLPFLVAVNGQGQVIGYTYANPMGLRPAFAWSIVTSIYLDQSIRGQGVGTRLYRALELILKQQHVVNMFACITVAKDDNLADVYGGNPARRKLGADDPHLPGVSPRFHSAYGFVPVGREIDCGYKLGRWYDKLWMEKHINSSDGAPEAVISLPDIDARLVHDVLDQVNSTGSAGNW